MYGTIATMRFKPEAEGQLQDLLSEYRDLAIPGHVETLLYQMDGTDGEYQLVVVFDDEASYRANAQSPEQDARYQRMLALLEAAPAWHDGAILYRG